MKDQLPEKKVAKAENDVSKKAPFRGFSWADEIARITTPGIPMRTRDESMVYIHQLRSFALQVIEMYPVSTYANLENIVFEAERRMATLCRFKDNAERHLFAAEKYGSNVAEAQAKFDAAYDDYIVAEWEYEQLKDVLEAAGNLIPEEIWHATGPSQWPDHAPGHGPIQRDHTTEDRVGEMEARISDLLKRLQLEEDEVNYLEKCIRETEEQAEYAEDQAAEAEERAAEAEERADWAMQRAIQAERRAAAAIRKAEAAEKRLADALKKKPQ